MRRATGLLPFDPLVVLDKIRPTTPSCISFTDKNGHRFNIPVSPSVEERLTEIFRQLLQGASPIRSQVVHNIRQFTLSTVADNTILKRTNQELLERQKKERCKTKAAYGKARVLSVAEAQKKDEEKLQKEQEEKRVKERKTALRGVITFAKKVWKELPIDSSVFI